MFVMQQLALPFKREEIELKIFFERAGGLPVALTITDNASGVLSVREKNGTLYVRIHGMFLGAGDDVLNEIAGFIKTRKGATPLLREFIRQNSKEIKKRAGRKISIKTAGKHYDLRDIFEAINNKYFHDRLDCPISWGTWKRGYAVRKRTLGSYNSRSNIIRINPLLDKPAVPPYFIEYVVYHEMLHADLGVELKNKRRTVHSGEFRRREKLFEDYERAAAWEKRL